MFVHRNSHYRAFGRGLVANSNFFSQFNSIYFKAHNIKQASNTNTNTNNNKSHGTNGIQLRNMF